MARHLYFVPFPRSREAVRRWAEEESLRKPDGDDRRFVIEDANGLRDLAKRARRTACLARRRVHRHRA
jgi:hypothetical protein